MKTLLTKSYQSDLTLVLEEILRGFEDLPVEKIKNFWNPQKCSEDLLPYLAIYLGVNQWDNSWDIAKKRRVCQNAFFVNRKKGTIKALKDALRALNISALVVEWFNDESLAKGTGAITLYEQDCIYSPAQYQVIYDLIEEVKRLSLWLNIVKKNAFIESVKIGGAVLITKRSYL